MRNREDAAMAIANLNTWMQSQSSACFCKLGSNVHTSTEMKNLTLDPTKNATIRRSKALRAVEMPKL